MKIRKWIDSWFETERKFPGGLRYFTMILPSAILLIVIIFGTLLYLTGAKYINYPFWQPLDHRIPIETPRGRYYLEPDPWRDLHLPIPPPDPYSYIPYPDRPHERHTPEGDIIDEIPREGLEI